MDKVQEKREEMNYKIRRLSVTVISTVVLFLLLIWATFRIGGPLVRLAAEPEQFQAWIDAKGIWGRAAFLCIQVLQVVVAVIPGEVIEIGAGYAFGAVEGTLLCMAGVTIGSAIIFGLTRLLGVKLVEAFISRKKIEELHWMKSEKQLHNLIFWVFFIPGTPKDLLTYFVGLTPIRITPFLVISTLARIPSIVSSTFGGHALGDRNYILAIVVFIATGVISLLGKFLYEKLTRYRKEKSTSDLKK